MQSTKKIQYRVNINLSVSDNDGYQFVKTFTNTLEHENAEGNADYSVGNTKRFAAHRGGRRMAVS